MDFNIVPAMDDKKDEVCLKAGQVIMNALKKGLTPKKIITKRSIENAIRAVAMTGGSTNAVLHLLAIANEMDIKLDLDDFESETVRRCARLLGRHLGRQVSICERIEAAKLQRLERRYLPMFDQVYVCSELDKTQIQIKYLNLIHATPNGLALLNT